MQDIPSLPICPSSTKYHKNPMFTSPILMKKKSDSGKSLSIFYHKYILNLTDGLNDSGMQSV